MRKADEQQTFFVDAAMQPSGGRCQLAFPRRRRRPHKGPAAHAAMLEMNNSYVIDEQLQSGLLPQSVMQYRAARGPSVEQ